MASTFSCLTMLVYTLRIGLIVSVNVPGRVYTLCEGRPIRVHGIVNIMLW